MAATIPTTEPTAPRAGDTWQWQRTLASYSAADGWEASYVFWTAADAYTITATGDGTTHSISVAPATTAAYTAGRYAWALKVTDGTNVHTLQTGHWQVLPAIGTALDTRSHARKMLEAINAMLEGRATDGDLDVVKTLHGDTATSYEPATLLKLRSQYAAAVAAEDAAEALARGDQSGRIIRTRFAR